jgi:ankyrin repeat protein
MSDSDSDYYSSEEDEVDIHHYVLTGTEAEVEWALSKDRLRMLNIKDPDGRLPLHSATKAGLMKMSVLLIKRGSFYDCKDGIAATPLMLAAGEGYTEIARMLLECGANIKMKDNNGWTCLHHAVNSAHIDCAVMLIKRGALLSAEEFKNGKTVLHLCAELGLADLADTLIVRGADMYASGDSIYSKTPLHLASMLGHKDVAEILVKRGADLEAMSGFLDKTPLHLAAEKGQLDTVQVLVEAGADMSAVGFNVNGNTPMHLAAQYGHNRVVSYLVSKGASMLSQGMWTVHGTPLHIAVQYGRLSVVTTILELGADMEQKDGNGLTAMHTACKYKQFDIGFCLIDKGANLTAEANNGRYPLEFIPPQEAYMKEKLRLSGLAYDQEMERLAELAAKKMREEEERAKAEQIAAVEAARIAAIALAEKQAREARFCALLLAATNISGELSALTDLSIEFSDLDINIELDSTLGSKAITRAAFNGFNVIVAALLKWDGIDINVQERDGNTALHMAASRGKPQHKSIVEMLLLHNARIGIANNAGKTPACVACTTYLGEIIRNPRLIQTRTQMEVMSLSPQMNNTRDKRAKALGNAMATATGGTNNLISLMNSTKIGANTSDVTAGGQSNNIFSPVMHDPATSLLADAYGQNYSPVKPLQDTWKIGGTGSSNEMKGQGQGPLGNQDGRYGGVNSNNIMENRYGKNEFHYSDPDTTGFAGPVPMTNEYGNIYLPPKFKTHNEVNYQRDLRGFNVTNNGSHSGVGYIHTQQQGDSGALPDFPAGPYPGYDGDSLNAGSSSVHTFNPDSLGNTLFPEGFGDPLAKSISQYALRDADPGYIYSHTHFAETNKIPPLISDIDAKKKLPKVDIDTENFTRGKFGPVPNSFRGCHEDLFFTEYNEIEPDEELETIGEGKSNLRARDLVSNRLINILNEQGVDYSGEEIDALVNGTELGIKDTSRLSRIQHIQFELGKIRNKKSIENVPAQASHTPTAFDLTDEWICIRDYLWLLGYPYKKSKGHNGDSDKRVVLKALATTMDEMHRIFTDPYSLATMKVDPLADTINNVNNYSKSETGRVRGAKELGDTRARFLQASSEEKMKEVGNEGVLPGQGNGRQNHMIENFEKTVPGKHDDDISIMSTDTLPNILNNSNMEGGGAFGGVKTKVLADPDSSSSPKPPSSIDQNQFIFANQKQPGPANSFDVPGPSTLAEAADLRIKRLCLDFVKFSVDVFAPQGGWHLPQGSAAVSESAMVTSRLTQVYNSGNMDDDLYRTLTKLLEASAQDVEANFQKYKTFGMKGVSGNHAMTFPPRKRRVLIDAMYDVSLAFKERAEQDFPVDSIRAHFWAHNGRKQLTRHIKAKNEDTDLTLWLNDLHIGGTIVAFKQLGFKELADFTDLCLEDVQEYFPFLKIGDAIRMARNIKLFTPELLDSYKRRATTGEAVVALPPLPGLIPPPVKKLQNNALGKRGPTPSRQVKAPITVPDPNRPKKKKVIVQDREPSREEYLSGVKISDYYLKQLQERISKETDGINIRRATDLEHANAIIREKGLVKQVIAKLNEENNVIIMRANDIDGAIEDLQQQISKATKGFQFRFKSDLTVANELVREAGLLGLVICHEDDQGDIQVMKMSDISSSIEILQEQITKATQGFNMRVSSDLEHATQMIREAGLYGIVVARETASGDIVMEQLHEEGQLWELFVNTIATHDTVDLGTALDGQDPSVKVWLGDELVGKTTREKDKGTNATFTDTFHMHMGKKTYKADHSQIVVEVYNESLIGLLEHVGKGHVDLKQNIPEEKFNEYVDIEVPLYYTMPGSDTEEVDKNGKPVLVKDTITDLDLEKFQNEITNATAGFNFRVSSDRTHATSMIKKRGYQKLLMAHENENGDILLRKIDKPMGTVTMRIMIQTEKQ